MIGKEVEFFVWDTTTDSHKPARPGTIISGSEGDESIVTLEVPDQNNVPVTKEKVVLVYKTDALVNKRDCCVLVEREPVSTNTDTQETSKTTEQGYPESAPDQPPK